ncbi:hypothetical protein FJ940_12115 [Mesorhizobium sp. B2-3-7]|nr:hypothetical protein FJ939_10300 [Mesorhizobium sp. B2-3-8]TPM16104.1 hypothetical protein FJ940_12115 [Mesorhizobium sp. B2-3-7]
MQSSLIPDGGGIEANLSALTDGKAGFFLTYAHPDVAFYLDRERFDFRNSRVSPALTIGSRQAIENAFSKLTALLRSKAARLIKALWGAVGSIVELLSG